MKKAPKPKSVARSARASRMTLSDVGVLMHELTTDNERLVKVYGELNDRYRLESARADTALAWVAREHARVLLLRQALTAALCARAELEGVRDALLAIITAARVEFCRDGSDESAASRMLKVLDVAIPMGADLAQARAEVCDAAARLQALLERTEESGGGNEFHPVTIGCCRVMLADPLVAACADLRAGLQRMALFSGEHGVAPKCDKSPLRATECASEGTMADLRYEAEQKLAAALRVIANRYVPWATAGGKDECKHGFAAGIPCPCCDRELIGVSVMEGV